MTEPNETPNLDRSHDFAAEPREASKDARMWAMFCHLAGLAAFLPIIPAFGAVIGPLVVWLLKKDEFPFVNEQGKEALNFQITMLIYGLISALLTLVCIGIFLAAAVVIVDIVFIIVAAIKTNDGDHYRYPPYLIFRFIK